MNKLLYPLFVRLLLVVMLAAAWTPAKATPYIRDVMLVGGSAGDIATGLATLLQQGGHISTRT